MNVFFFTNVYFKQKTHHQHTELEKPALDQGQTDCISLPHDLDYLQSPASYGQRSVSSEDRVETNGRTGGGYCITCHINAVGKHKRTVRINSHVKERDQLIAFSRSACHLQLDMYGRSHVEI